MAVDVGLLNTGSFGSEANAIKGLLPDYAAEEYNRRMAAVQEGQVRLAQRKQQAEDDDDAAFQADWAELEKNPSVSGWVGIIARHPKQAEALKAAYGIEDKATDKAEFQLQSNVFNAAANGEWDLAAETYQRRVDADNAAGKEDKSDQAILAMIKSGDPAQRNKAVAMMGYALAARDPEHFASTYKALFPDADIRETDGIIWNAKTGEVLGRTPYSKFYQGPRGGFVEQLPPEDVPVIGQKPWGGQTAGPGGFAGGSPLGPSFNPSAPPIYSARPGQGGPPPGFIGSSQGDLVNAPGPGPAPGPGGILGAGPGAVPADPLASLPESPATVPTPTGAATPPPGQAGPPPAAPGGPLVPGNIDLSNRPVVHNKDGSISTVLSTSIGTPQGEVLIPRVSDDGRIMSEPEAAEQFRRTGRHLGVFANPADATAYAQRLSAQQGQNYSADGSHRSTQRPPPVVQAARAKDFLVDNAKAVIQSIFPDAQVTDWKRDPKSALGRAHPTSWHNLSAAAVDVAPMPGLSFKSYVDRIKREGYKILESRDEVNHPSKWSTGPHWHAVLQLYPARSKQEYDRVPNGGRYLHPDGQVKRKGQGTG